MTCTEGRLAVELEKELSFEQRRGAIVSHFAGTRTAEACFRGRVFRETTERRE